MSNKLKVRIITPHAVEHIYDADMVVMPGSNGELGAMFGHVPMIVGLKPGDIRIYNGVNNITPIHITSGGVARICADSVDILYNGV